MKPCKRLLMPRWARNIGHIVNDMVSLFSGINMTAYVQQQGAQYEPNKHHCGGLPTFKQHKPDVLTLNH